MPGWSKAWQVVRLPQHGRRAHDLSSLVRDSGVGGRTPSSAASSGAGRRSQVVLHHRRHSRRSSGYSTVVGRATDPGFVQTVNCCFPGLSSTCKDQIPGFSRTHKTRFQRLSRISSVHKHGCIRSKKCTYQISYRCNCITVTVFLKFKLTQKVTNCTQRFTMNFFSS